MGFFDVFKNIWSNGWTWKNVENSFSTALSDVKNAGSSLVGGLWDTIKAVTPGPWTDFQHDGMKALNEYGDFASSAFSAGANFLGGVTQVPVLNQAFSTLSEAQNQLIKRPIGTLNLVGGDVGRTWMNQLTNGAVPLPKGGPASLFSGQEWRQAYDDTRTVSAGQAAMYGGPGAVLSDAVRSITSGKPQMYTNPDPRTPEGQAYYQKNAAAKWGSGVADLGLDFVDPTVWASKLGMAVKLKYLSKLMNAAAIDKGANVTFAHSAQADRLFEFARRADNSEVVRQMALNGHTDGGLMAKVITDAAKIPDRDTALSVYRDTLQHLTTPMVTDDNGFTALQRIAQVAPRVSRAVGDIGDGANFGSVAKDFGTGDAVADALVNARRPTDTQAFLDDAANGNEWGRAGGALLNQTAPRRTLTSQWRVSVHNYANFTRGTFFADAPRRIVRAFLPSSTFTRIINFEDPAATAVDNLRANWEGSRVLTPDELNNLVEQYGSATDANGRFQAFVQGENYIFRKIADKYKFTPEQVNAAIANLNSMHASTRAAFSQSRMYMSNEARKMAQELWDNNQFDEASRLNNMADEMDAAIKRGDAPDSVAAQDDLDGHQVLFPLSFDKNFDVARTPLLSSQHADLSAAMDWRYLHNALWWESKGPVASKAYRVLDQGRALLDAATSVWKVASLLRPGYTWRMLTDEQSRALAMIGAGPAYAAAVKGMSNLVQNTMTRLGRFRDETYLEQKAARGLDTHDVVTDADVDAEGVAQTDLAEARPYLDERPRTPDEVAAAILKRNDNAPHLVPDDIKDMVARHAAAGTDPTVELAKWVEANGVPKGLKDTVKVTKTERKVNQTYTTLGKAVADGVIEPQAYVDAAQSAFHNRPRDVTPDMAYIIRQHLDAGTDPFHDLVEHALYMNERDAYAKPDWVQGLLDHVGGVEGPKPANFPAMEAGARKALVDPFSGTSPTNTPDITGFRNVVRLNPGAERQALNSYVRDNFDELLKPDSLLHVETNKDGLIEAGIAKTTGAQDVTKPTGGRRLKIKGHLFDYKQNGAGGLNILLRNGQRITIDHMFDGADGERSLAQVSSRGEGKSWANRMVDQTFTEQMQATRNIMRDIAPNEIHYAPSWERVVNNQLANDPVARQIMLGVSDDDIVSWLRKSPQGQQYLQQLGPWQRYYWSQVTAVRNMLHLYVPVFGEQTEATAALKQAFLDRDATFDHLKAVVPNPDDMPHIHGNAIEAAVAKGQINQLYSKAVEKTFKVLGDIPADRMARFPFAAERYAAHVQSLADAYLAGFAKNGESYLPTEAITQIKEQARRRVGADVQKYLYDATTQHDMARLMRLVVPFGSAIADGFLKWGVISREKPWVPYNLWKIWTSPDRAGFTTDQDGNTKRIINGQPRWVQYNPITKKETVLPETYQPQQQYVSLQLASDLLPSFLTGQVDGVKLVPRVNKETFNTFLGLPTAGPIVAAPANAFALDHPEFADNKFIQRFVLPFGTQSSSGSMFVPGALKTAYDLFKGQDKDLATSQALAIWQTEMVNYARGDRAKPPTIAEARDKAAKMKGLRWLYQEFGMSPSFVTPYQPYVDYYRQLRAADPVNADSMFYDQAGPEFFALTAAVTRNAAGIPATVNGEKAYQKYKSLIDQYPDLAPLIVGAEGAGAFSQSVYNWQKTQTFKAGDPTHMREPFTLEQSIEDVAKREGWIKYGKLMSTVDAELLNRGLNSVNQRGAEDLKEARDQFMQNMMYWTGPTGVQSLNPWYIAFNTLDQSAITGRLNAMSQIINDPRLRQRDDIRGLTDYLAARKQMTDMMAADDIKTLNSNKAANLRASWDAYVMQLRDQNLAFADLYHRWLTHDQYLDSPT